MEGDGEGGATLTYYRDVKPIVDARCTKCHVAGGIAPFPLTSYEDVAEAARFIGPIVRARIMPPWLAGPDCAEYEDDESLTDEQIATLSDWAELPELPAGDPADEGPALAVDTTGLTRVDATLEMPREYSPDASLDDDYRCFVVPWPEDARRFIAGFRARPGNATTVHHIIAYLAQPEDADMFYAMDPDGEGYTCFGGVGGGAPTQWVGAWAPGGLGQDYPEGTGIPVDPGSAIVLQIHYNTDSWDRAPDRTAVEFKLEDSVEQAARIEPVANPAWRGGGMTIPAGDADVVHDYTLRILDGVRLTVYSAGLHMHALGSAGRVELRREDGATECLLGIPRWDFAWQRTFQLAEPREVDPGDEMHMECRWDNSGGEKDVAWGEGTGDEMCLALFYVTAQ